MSNKCLLIKAKGGKKFLTHEKNLPSLIEFAKTFKSELFLVQIKDDQKVLELKGLTAAFCDPTYNSNPQFENIERIFPRSKRDRKNILNEAENIRKFVTDKLLEGNPVSLKQLKEKYKDQKLTDACLCNHLSMARLSLSKEGCSFEKIAAGTYCLVK